MPPLEVRMQNDDTFLSSLSAQREYLNLLNLEHEQRGNWLSSYPSQERRSSAIADDYTTQVTSNAPISAPNQNHEVIFAKRFSIGNDDFVQSNSFPDCEDIGAEYEGKRKRKYPFGSNSMMKRRGSDSSLIDFVFGTQSRRGSTGSQKRHAASFHDHFLSDDDISIEPLEYNQGSQNPFDIRDRLVSFDGAMKRSQDSQQKIHDWDKKMGLKRSHSKTMRLSSKSRKKLRAMLRKEIVAVSFKIS